MFKLPSLPKLPRLPKLPGQEEPPKLWPSTFPSTTIPTPFGDVHLPEHKIELLKLPSLDKKTMSAIRHAIAIDGAMVPAMVPWVGDVLSDVIEDLHFAELRKILTSRQYDEFIK